MGFEDAPDDPMTDLPDDVYEKLDEAVTSAFGDIDISDGLGGADD